MGMYFFKPSPPRRLGENRSVAGRQKIAVPLFVGKPLVNHNRTLAVAEYVNEVPDLRVRGVTKA